ncbi:MAG: hypothetical protein V2I43_10615 [Parvularcula sp.]|nr:hypothetical protein [Parvularcula sp.]
MRKNQVFEGLQRILEDIVGIGPRDRVQSVLGCAVSLEQSVEISGDLVEIMACGNKMFLHDPVHPIADGRHASNTEVREFGFLVDRVMAHFGPSMIQKGQDLNLDLQPVKLTIFGEGQAIRL